MAMQAMNNDQLTVAIQELQNTVQGINVQLGDLIPTMAKQIADSSALATTLDAKLQLAVNPLLDADLITAMTRMSETQETLRLMSVDCDRRLKEVITKVESEAAQAHQRADDLSTIKTHTTGVHNRVSEFVKDLDETQQKIKDEARKQDMRDTQYQQQMATLNSMIGTGGGSSSTGSRSRPDEPIVVHKLIINKPALSGTESFEAIDEWYEDMTTDIEMILPGAKAILQEAEKMKRPIMPSDLLGHDQSALATRVSREMYSVLKKKTTGVARNQIKTLSENDGLEAWRLIRLNLCNKDDQHVEAEYKVKSRLPKFSMKNMSGLAELITRWEAEIKRFATIDEGYNLSNLQKKNAVYEALPDDLQKVVDIEVSKPGSNLRLYPQWIEFIKDWSRSYQFQHGYKPTPLTANLVDNVEPVYPTQNAEQLQYTTDQWIAWLQEDEGKVHVAQGLPLPAEGTEALYAVMQKGKGKGNWQSGGWQIKGKGKGNWQTADGKSGSKGFGKTAKGKGKGKNWDEKGNFIGKCNRCGKGGHMARDCPDAALNPVEQYWIGSDWSPGRSSSEPQSPQTGVNMVTLCLTQDSQVDYRLNQKTNLVKPLKFVPTYTSTNFPIDIIVDNNVAEETEFPLLDQSVTQSKQRVKLSKFKKSSQKKRKQNDKKTLNCDADSMPMKRFMATLNRGKNKDVLKLENEAKKVEDPVEAETEDSEVPPPPTPTVTRSRAKTGAKTKVRFSAPTCGCGPGEDDCCGDEAPASNAPAEEPSSTAVPDERPPPIHWKTQLDEAIKKEEMQWQASKLPGCGAQCGLGVHHLATCKAFSMNLKNFRNIDSQIAPRDNVEAQMRDSSLNIITTEADLNVGIMNIESGLVWMQVPCAVDSGACSHVAPPNLFAILGPKTLIEKPKFFGADGSPIENFGECPVKAVLDDNTQMNTLFNIAKITRPLLSVTQMTNNGHQVVFGKDESYVRISNSAKKIKLRKDGQLWMLDMWVQVPEDIARASPFARQVTQA